MDNDAKVKPEIIYLDVSSTAVSPIFTGIPRVVRTIAEHRNLDEVCLIEFDGLRNSYKRIQELPPVHTSTESASRTRRAVLATKLYKSLTENVIASNIVTFILRNRFIFYVARRLLGAPSPKGEVLREMQGTLFLPEVPVHTRHVKKILKLQRSESIKVALYVHDLLPLQHPDFFSDELVRKFDSFLELIKAADLILVSNEDVKNQVKHTFNKKDVQVVQLPSAYNQTPPTLEPKSQFLVVGTLEPRKNHLAILDSFERLHQAHPDIELVLVGNLGWKYTDIVHRISTMQNRGVRLRWIKNLSDEDLQREYQQAIALLYPSHYEGYGLPVVEALSQSTPVITSNRPAMRLFTNFGGVSLINPENSDELCAEMARMLDVEYRNTKASEIQLDQIPTNGSIFTEQCFLAIKEV
jgi:glycosyltransferase involved in cell wall biosynthesis